MTTTIEQVVEQIRDWEMDAGEGYCDYFFDKYSYDGKWLDFLESKGYKDLVDEIKEDVYVLTDGRKLVCTDQQLKFEPHSKDGEWSEETYRKDVALWAEFIIMNKQILDDHLVFIVDYFQGGDEE